jgi:hypothetical protein
VIVGENLATNGVQVFENTSTGPLFFTFAAAVGFDTANPVTRVAVADMNRDLWDELVVGENTAATGLQIFENIIVNPNDTIGAGSFAAPVTFATAAPVTALQLAFLGGATDLQPDVVVGTNAPATGIQVRINNLAFPNATITAALLGAPTSFATVAQVTDLLVSDLDNDGLLDILASNNGAPTTGVQAFPGTGTAALFDLPLNVNDGGLADGANRFIALRDLTGDGFLDLIVIADVTANLNESVIPNTSTAPGGGVTPPPSPPTQPVTLTPNQRFVNNLYLDLMGRGADPAGLSFWTGQLNSGVPRGNVALALADSFEALAQNVRRAFREFLHRDPETAALIQFTHLLQLGRPIIEVEVAVVSSAEFQSLPGGFLANLYARGLKRSLDPNGNLFWQTLLSAGKMSVQQVALAILSNTERAAILVNFPGTAAAGFSDIGFYQQFLNKNGDVAGAAFWTNVLAALMFNRQQVLAAFVSTNEYFNLP